MFLIPNTNDWKLDTVVCPRPNKSYSYQCFLHTPSPRSAAEPPGCRDKQPITSVSCHPHPARWDPSELPPSAGPGSRPGPPCGTCHSWCRINPPCSTPFRFINITIIIVVVIRRCSGSRPAKVLVCPAVPPEPVAPDQWRSAMVVSRDAMVHTVWVTVLPVAEVVLTDRGPWSTKKTNPPK